MYFILTIKFNPPRTVADIYSALYDETIVNMLSRTVIVYTYFK